MLFTLFQNEIQGNEIKCSLPFELISTSSYDITMTLPIYSTDQIEIYLSYDGNTKEVICSKQLFGMEYITIFATSPNSSANEISFKCDNQNQKTIQFLNKDNIKIIFRGNNFYLSHYRVSVDIKNSNYYTKTGLEKCQSKLQ